ncbi:MAG: translocation/assembly module TamB domain-containing protein, partial [Pseudomonadota bacterium]
LALRATAEVRGAEGGASEISVALQQLSHRGASGSGSAALRDGVAEGRFRLDAPDLSRFAGLVGADLTGSARATLALSRSRGAQAIALESEALGFAAGPDGTADRVSARVAGRADAPSIALSAEGLSVAGLRDATAELEGGLRLGDATAFTARALSLRNRDLDLRLAGPTTATARGGTVSVAETTLLVNDGRIVGRGVVGRTADVAVAVENLPLDLLSTLDLAPVATGRLSGEARLDSGRAQSGVAVFSIEDVGVGRSGERLSEAELFDLRLDGRWDGRAVAASLALQPEGADPLRVEARVPAAGAPFPSIRPDAPVEGAIRWSGDVAALWPIVPVEDVDLSGALAVDLALSGTLDAPALGGRAELEDGRLLVVASGTDLRALNAEITPESDGRVRIVGTATDAEGETPGRLTLEGVVDPAGETAIAITARDAVLVRRDDAAARLDLDVEARVGGAAPVIRGAALVKEAEFRLIGEGATQPPLIEVQIEGEERRRARPEPARPIALDLTVRAPERVFVRGRGLESEWGGELAIGGTVADPSVVGEIAARRGRFTFAGAPFLLDGSTVRFTGPPDPLLAVRLTRRTDAVAGAIAVTGAASAPELAFSSTPALPEDEILPQLIFGRPLAQLTAVEAAQIASGLAALTSGRPGALDAARELVGVDTLDVDQGADGSARLRAGRYVAPGVFVEGRQGVEPGDQSVAVEIEITPEVRLESEAGRDGEPSVGVEWRRDY